MSAYEYDFGVGTQAVDTMTTVTGNVRQDLQDIDSYIRTNLFPVWEDDARNEYEAVQQKWNQDAEQMGVHLESTKQALAHIGEGYHTGMQRGVGIWSATG